MDGILYSAIGEPWLAEALLSARSSLRFNAIPHEIVTDQPQTAEADGVRFRVVASTGNPYADKIRSLIATPFDRTIYLDGDTYVLGDITHLFELLETFDLAAAHAPAYRGLDDPEVPRAFYELNTGVIAWRSTPAVRMLFGDWLQTYERWRANPPFERAGMDYGIADQPAFRRCAWRHRHAVRIWVLGPEYGLRTKFSVYAAGRVPIIHGRHRDYETIGRIVNATERPRVFPKGQFAETTRPAVPDREGPPVETP